MTYCPHFMSKNSRTSHVFVAQHSQNGQIKCSATKTDKTHHTREWNRMWSFSECTFRLFCEETWFINAEWPTWQRKLCLTSCVGEKAGVKSEALLYQTLGMRDKWDWKFAWERATMETHTKGVTSCFLWFRGPIRLEQKHKHSSEMIISCSSKLIWFSFNLP